MPELPPWIVTSALICVPGALSVTVVCADAVETAPLIAIRAMTSGMRRKPRAGEHTTFAMNGLPGASRAHACRIDEECGRKTGNRRAQHRQRCCQFVTCDFFRGFSSGSRGCAPEEVVAEQ